MGWAKIQGSPQEEEERGVQPDLLSPLGIGRERNRDRETERKTKTDRGRERERERRDHSSSLL